MGEPGVAGRPGRAAGLARVAGLHRVGNVFASARGLTAARIAARTATLRATPPTQVLLRAVLLVDGGLALLLSAAGNVHLAGRVLLVAGFVALAVSAVAPGGLAPGGVLAAAGLGWLLRFGLDGQVPAGSTVAVAVLLYLFHDLAALLAAVPAAAPVGRDVLGRWYAVTLAVAAVTVPLGLATFAVDGSGGNPADVLGLLGAVALAGVPVLLARRGR